MVKCPQVEVLELREELERVKKAVDRVLDNLGAYTTDSAWVCVDVSHLDNLRYSMSDNQHNWVCVSPGLYDSSYKCLDCGDTNITQLDNPIKTDNPVGPCNKSIKQSWDIGLRVAAEGKAARKAYSAKVRAKNTKIVCPVCGYYCLGKGGVGCIDKPALVDPGREA